MAEKLPSGYLALPSSEQPAPAVLALHAWWGLNDFFKQLCDRLAKEGFVVFAPDLYDGNVATTIEQAETYRNAMEKKWKDITPLLRNTAESLRQHPRAINQPIGVIGFSLGVFFELELIEQTPEVARAAVVFYGTRESDYQGVKAAVQGHFASSDDFEPQTEVDKMEAALKAAGADVSFYIYPNTGHWFFESDRPDACNADAAKLAWERTVAFFKAKLATGK